MTGTVAMKMISVFSAMCSLLLVHGTEISVEGPEGGVVSFQCSHKHAHNNKKYFCKNPCSAPEHTLATVQPGTMTGSEKITLWDKRDGVFNVTVHNLSIADTGTYWCAVERFLIHTFTRVDLRVTKVKRVINYHVYKTTTKNIDPGGGTEVTTSKSFESSSTQTRNTITNSTAEIFQSGNSTASLQGFTLYLTVGVVVVFTVCAVVPLSLRKCREMSRPQVQVCPRLLQLISSNQHQLGDQNGMVDNPKYGLTAALRQQNQNQPIYENISYGQRTGHTTDAALSRNDHFPSYISPLPALPEQESVKMVEATPNGEACAEQPSLWFGLPCPQT